MKRERKRVIPQSELIYDSKTIKNCDRDRCFHSGEGCGIRYPEEKIPSTSSGLSVRGLDPFVNTMQSRAFEEFWERQLGPRFRDEILPCSHSNTTGCTFFICKHLDHKDMMSDEYREFLNEKKKELKRIKDSYNEYFTTQRGKRRVNFLKLKVVNEYSLWQQKSEDDIAEACFLRGLLFENGIVEKQSLREARKWYRKATDQGLKPDYKFN